MKTHLAVTVIAWILLSSCAKRSSEVADEIDRFAASDVLEVKVFSLESIPEEGRDYETTEDLIRLQREVTGSHFCRYPVVNVVSVGDPDKLRKIVSAVTSAVRSQASGAKCFEPHHGIQIVKDAATMEVVICYSCELIQVHDGIQPARYDTTARASQRVLEAALAAKP